MCHRNEGFEEFDTLSGSKQTVLFDEDWQGWSVLVGISAVGTSPFSAYILCFFMVYFTDIDA